MDILDIDEIEDDFGIFEDKVEDDVINILKQWKIGNNKKDAVFDSRTFTRPKGSIIRNSIDGTQLKSPQLQENHNLQNGISMKIGGLVSNVIQKSFLNDISPPNSICSPSINIDSENQQPMSNSLITSADFTGISFFKTSLIESNLDYAFENNLKEFKENEKLLFHNKYSNNIPNDLNDMKSSVSKDNDRCDSEKFDKMEQENICENENYMTDSTKENSPNCLVYDNDGCSSFHNNTQILTNTFTKRLSINHGDDNSITSTKRFNSDANSSIDINRTFLRKSKIEAPLNQTFDQIEGNINITLNVIKNRTELVNNKDEKSRLSLTNSKYSDEIFDDVANEDKKNIDRKIGNLSNNNNFKTIDIYDGKPIQNFTTTTSTPQKLIENQIDKNIDFSPITPFSDNLKIHQKHDIISSDENIAMPIETEVNKVSPIMTNTFKKTSKLAATFDKDDLDIDDLSDDSDKMYENAKEEAMRKSLENIKKRYSHKFDKPNGISLEKSAVNVQKIFNQYPGNGRLLSRRSRLNDDFVLNQNVSNESVKNQFDNSISYENNLKNSYTISEQQETLEFEEAEIANKVEHGETKPESEKEIIDDEKDIDTKKIQESTSSKRTRNDDRFKTIKIDKPLTEHFRQKEFPETNDEYFNSPTTAFSRIDKNTKLTNFTNDPLKFEKSKFSETDKQQFNSKLQQISNSKQPIVNLKFERLSKLEKQLGKKAISASSLDEKSQQGLKITNESNINYKFAIPNTIPAASSAAVKKVKSPMGTKAKSFHNLASNNHFGFTYKKSTSSQIPPSKSTITSIPDSTNNSYTVENLNEKNNTNNKNDCYLLNNKPTTLRPKNPQKRTGLIRPSSGYYSRGLPSETAGFHQSTQLHKENSSKPIKPEVNCSNLPNTNHSEVVRKSEVSTKIGLKIPTTSSKLTSQKPTASGVMESKLPTQVKRSGLPRPSTYYRK